MQLPSRVVRRLIVAVGYMAGEVAQCIPYALRFIRGSKTSLLILYRVDTPGEAVEGIG